MGCGRLSLRDFHSFRLTWVTVALNGWRAVGDCPEGDRHRTTAIVLKPCFQPGREEFRRTLAGKLPALPGDRSKPAAEAFNVADLRAKLTAMEPTTWRVIRDELLTRLPKEVNVTPATTCSPKRDIRSVSAPRITLDLRQLTINVLTIKADKRPSIAINHALLSP